MSKITSKRKAIQITSDIAGIILTKGEIALVDAKYASCITNWNWIADFGRGMIYARRRQKTETGYQDIYLHRVIAGYALGRELRQFPIEKVDHVDGDGLNCVSSNLRLATGSQNAQNRKTRIDNITRYKGVHLYKSTGKWCARIQIKDKRKFLGYFGTPEEAHEAYVKAAILYYGEFAKFK